MTDLEQGAVAARRQLEITGNQEIVIEIATGEISGQVLTAGGLAPVAGAVIELRSPDVAPARPPAVRDVADALGRFELYAVVGQRWQLRGALRCTREIPDPSSSS